MDVGQLILVVGAVLAVAVGASVLAARLRTPAMLLFLALGMVLGSDITGWVDFADYALAKDAATVGLGLILFDIALTVIWFVAIRWRWTRAERREERGRPEEGFWGRLSDRLRSIGYVKPL